MKWKDHVKITAEICGHFGLKNCREIAQASVLPDKDPDHYWAFGRRGRAYLRRVPHHELIAIGYALLHLKRARRLYLRNKRYYEFLGRALHYLQDYAVDPTENIWIFSYRSELAHEKREKLDLSVDFNAVKNAMDKKCYPHEFKSFVFKTKRGKNADEIVFASSYLTALAFKMLLNPDKPEKLEEEYGKAKITHIVLLIIPWIFLIALVQGLAYLFLSAIASAILHLADYNYHKWKLDYDWFNTS
ncbi:MAG: hypothetical protein NZ879_04595 [Archaeoglobaceae archaeon]|nr:hypothetical protein [Archaeoglobaceae archaeon]MDW8118242.1 hypothetical protein [Archaeoglobaceae archaeon]